MYVCVYLKFLANCGCHGLAFAVSRVTASKTLVYCGWMTKQIRLFFLLWGYFVLNGGLEPSTGRETLFCQRWGVGIRKFLALATPRSSIPAVTEVLLVILIWARRVCMWIPDITGAHSEDNARQCRSNCRPLQRRFTTAHPRHVTSGPRQATDHQRDNGSAVHTGHLAVSLHRFWKNSVQQVLSLATV